MKLNRPLLILRRLLGVVLIVPGAVLFSLFTGSINAATYNGPPMNMFGGSIEWLVIVLILDLIFLSMVFGGVKLAGYGWRVFGLIVLVLGIATLSLGIWNYIDGPPIDLDSDHPDERFPVSPLLNFIVYFCAGVCISAGLLITTWGWGKEKPSYPEPPH